MVVGISMGGLWPHSLTVPNNKTFNKYPLVNSQLAIERGPVEIVDLSSIQNDDLNHFKPKP